MWHVAQQYLAKALPGALILRPRSSHVCSFPTGQHEVIRAVPVATKPQGCSDSGSPSQEGTGLALNPSLGPMLLVQPKPSVFLRCEFLSSWDGMILGWARAEFGLFGVPQ